MTKQTPPQKPDDDSISKKNVKDFGQIRKDESNCNERSAIPPNSDIPPRTEISATPPPASPPAAQTSDKPAYMQVAANDSKGDLMKFALTLAAIFGIYKIITPPADDTVRKRPDGLPEDKGGYIKQGW